MMDEHLSVDGSDCSNVGLSGRLSSRTKFQPIRVKALLHFCESDEDENEDKERDSETESDCDETRPISRDSNGNSPNESFERIEGCVPLDAVNKEKDSKSSNGVDSNHSLTQGRCNDARETDFQDAAQAFRANVQSQTASVDNELYTDNGEERKGNDYRRTHSSISHEINMVDKGHSVLHRASTFSHPSEYEFKMNKSANLEFGNVAQSGNDNMHLSEKKAMQSKNQPQKSESGGIENVESQEEDNVKHKNLESSMHDDWSKRSKSEIESQQEFRRSTSANFESVLCSQSNSGMPQSTLFNPHSYNVKHGALESMGNRDEKHLHHSNPQYSETIIDAAVSSSVNPIITETPLKHVPEGNALRPNPCLSHRNIFQTPQNKLQNDFSRNQVQTPATTLNQWVHNAKKQTPLQSRSQVMKDFVQTPSNSVFGMNAVSHITPRYSGMENKGVRRPLTDSKCVTPFSCNNDTPAFPLESKPRIAHGSHLPNVEEVVNESQTDSAENKSANVAERGDKAPVACLEKKFLQAHAFHAAESKGNHHSNVTDASVHNEKLLHNSASDNRATVSSNAQANAKNDLPQRYEQEAAAVPQPRHSEVKNQFSSANDKKAQQGTGQLPDAVPSVQFSMPTNVPKQRQNKTITVKGKEYLILGNLGQGMSGEVLRVQDLASTELRAIKCVNLSRMDKDSAQGCLEEISMLHKLQAPCVIRMFDYEVKYPMVYVVMEMGDTDLSRLLKSMSQEKSLPLTMILYYWTEMLTAVKHIHDNGVIHSDLKPANFLLVRGRLKLIDFGIASSMNADMTSVVKNCPIGTLNYISPEALMDVGNGDSPDHKVRYKISFKSDVWSLGCILYSLVYGHTPFHHIRSQWAKLNAITNPKPNIIFSVHPSSADGERKIEPPPPILIDVMRKCLQHDPKARPTVTQLLQVEYVPSKPAAASISVPANLLVKVKHALSEEEWRQLIQILESRRRA